MKIKYLHPRDEIIEIINRLYQNGMTTTSGGNLSILDDDGSVWITPKAVDKGTLTSKDIVRVLPNGDIDGIHKPSSEYPFHLAVYKARSDVKSVLHAHPPALVSFAIARKIPDTSIIPKAKEICGNVGYAEYALPGSEELGKVIASKIKDGHDSVLMENHGIVTVGKSLMEAFQRLETLDFCAQLTLKGNSIGKVKVLSNDDLDLSREEFILDEFEVQKISSSEKELRKNMCELIHRSYSQKLVTSTEGTFSARINENEFLITPWGQDRKYLSEEDLVLIKGDKKESGKKPSRSVKLHISLYKKHPQINSIIIAHPPNILAFGVTEVKFDSRTIPESYLVLKDIPKLPYGLEFGKETFKNRVLEDIISNKTPVVICENNCIIVIGENLLQTYDRLEVAEFSAQSVIASKSIGAVVPIQQRKIEELERVFKI